MSGDTLDRQQNTPPEEKEGKESPKRSLFNHLNSDLQEALNSWEVITQQMANKISPEEEQLLEVKRLLGDLKAKLKEFGD